MVIKDEVCHQPAYCPKNSATNRKHPKCSRLSCFSGLCPLYPPSRFLKEPPSVPARLPPRISIKLPTHIHDSSHQVKGQRWNSEIYIYIFRTLPSGPANYRNNNYYAQKAELRESWSNFSCGDCDAARPKLSSTRLHTPSKKATDVYGNVRGSPLLLYSKPTHNRRSEVIRKAPLDMTLLIPGSGRTSTLKVYNETSPLHRTTSHPSSGLVVSRKAAFFETKQIRLNRNPGFEYWMCGWKRTVGVW